MRISELIEAIKIAFDAMSSNKMRSALASLGVVIGISVVIMMGWVLGGLDKAMMDTFNIIGSDMLYVDKWDWAGGKNWKELRQRKPITLQQSKEFCERLQSAELAYPSARQYGGSTIKYGNKSVTGISVNGTSSEQGMAWGGDIESGRHFSLYEDKSGSHVVILGSTVNKSIFPDGNAVGQTIKIKGRKFRVIGVLKKQGTVFFDFVDNVVYIPLRTFLKIYGKFGRSLSINIKARTIDDLDEIRAETRGLMREIRNNNPGEEDDFSINEVKAFEELISTFRLYVWSIGIGITVLSFLVGIIGIMNIMFVSVTERTKEIGIRKAIGAKKSSILLQFLVEASALCFIGAILSLVICSVIVYLIATWLPTVWEASAFLLPYLPFELLVIASSVSIFVGMLAGFIPALRASNLNPVDALRFE